MAFQHQVHHGFSFLVNDGEVLRAWHKQSYHQHSLCPRALIHSIDLYVCVCIHIICRCRYIAVDDIAIDVDIEI